MGTSASKVKIPDTMPLFTVTVDKNPESRIDKDRETAGTNTALFPAKLKDAGRPINAVAKVIKILKNSLTCIMYIRTPLYRTRL